MPFLFFCIPSLTIVHLRKIIFVPRGPRTPDSGPFEHLQLDFCQLSLSMSYQYVPVIICMVSKWLEAFPCHKTNELTVTKKLLENVFPTWGISFIISSDWSTHFTGQITWVLTKTLQTSWNYNCLYHPQLVKRTKGKSGFEQNKTITWEWMNWWEWL